MKNAIKRYLTLYLNRLWLQALLFLILLGGFIITAIPRWKPLAIVANALLCATGMAFLGVISASIWNLIKKRWTKGIINVLLVFACGTATAFAFRFLMFSSMFGPSEDGFADNLTIPANVELTEPLSELNTSPGEEEDAFQQSLLVSLSTPGNNDPTITADVDMLLKLHGAAPEVLMRFLAASPSWRVFEERENVFATRRWMIGSQWRYDLHGYYTRHNIGFWSKADLPNFQSRFTIGFSGKPWARASGDATKMDAGQTRSLNLSTGNRMHESRCLIKAGNLTVDVFEQSEAKERRLTKTALSHVERELSPLVLQPDWNTIRSILPDGSIRNGDAVFNLWNSFQPGIYDSEIWVNPGEPGMIYLKAFEVTKGTPLSIDRLKERSNEWVGWSDDPAQLFFSNTHFTIYEGDWGQPYAARFEVWFAPDSGKSDRKLIEKIFKIEGWQR